MIISWLTNYHSIILHGSSTIVLITIHLRLSMLRVPSENTHHYFCAADQPKGDGWTLCLVSFPSFCPTYVYYVVVTAAHCT
jgi:hypothetical protein